MNGEVRRGFKQEKLIEYFFLLYHNGTHEDIEVQIIGHCESKDQESREDFWVLHLDTLHPKGLKEKYALKYWINWFRVLMTIFDLTLVGHIYKKIIAWIITNTSK